MVKVRIHEIAKELGIKSKEVIEKAKEIDIEAKVANSTVSGEDAQNLMNFIMGKVPVKTTKNSNKEQENISSQKEATVKNTKENTTENRQDSKIVEKEQIVVEKNSNEDKKESSVQKDAPKNLKDEPKKDEKKAQESNSKEEKKESLAKGANLKKRRRGLVIVKKRKPKPEEKIEIPTRNAQAESLKDLIRGNTVKTDESFINAHKKKKKIKKTPTTRQGSSQKLNLDIGAGTFSEISIESDSDYAQEIMPDINNIGALNEDKEKEKKKTNQKKNNPPGRGGRGGNKRFSGKRSVKRGKVNKKIKRKKEDEIVTSIEIPEEIRLYEFAEKMKKSSSEVISSLFKLGLLVTRNDFLDKDAIEILADEFEIEVKTINALEELDRLALEHKEEMEALQKAGGEGRPPVITIMGHVDHGKTSLLDKIRDTDVTAKEHGGITQHIGAYMVNKNGHNITFLDTPGHDAFTHMRARGAQVTDIVIIVVAADDGVKDRTKEAIEHARAANAPIIVAINKIDKPNANPELVKGQLAELDITPVEWGGSHEFVEISAKTGEGIDDLLEIILLQSEILELRADQDADAKATVIESTTKRGRGSVATIIVQNGTLRVGNTVVCGVAYGRVRALLDENDNNLEAIHPGEPGVVVGLSEVPHTGEHLFRVEDLRQARELASKKAEHLRQKELSRSTKVTLEELSDKIAEGKLKRLPVIVKADVGGSLEAIKARLEKLRNDEVKVHIVSSGVGGITESDIALAEASENCIIIGYHIRPTGAIKKKASDLGVNIHTYNVIFDLEDDIKSLLSGLLSPVHREEALGQAEVRDVFRVPQLGAIAGCLVTEGSINRGVHVRVIREGVIIFEGKISSLKRFKDDVKEVGNGYECGIGVEGYNDIKAGDFLESFKLVEEKKEIELG